MRAVKDGTTFPSIGIQLSEYEYNLIKDKRPDFYKIENRIYFNILDENGKETGDKMIYIYFK